MIYRIYNPRNSHSHTCYDAEEAFKYFIALGKNSKYLIEAESAEGTVYRVSVKVIEEAHPEQAGAGKGEGGS